MAGQRDKAKFEMEALEQRILLSANDPVQGVVAPAASARQPVEQVTVDNVGNTQLPNSYDPAAQLPGLFDGVTPSQNNSASPNGTTDSNQAGTNEVTPQAPDRRANVTDQTVSSDPGISSSPDGLVSAVGQLVETLNAANGPPAANGTENTLSFTASPEHVNLALRISPEDAASVQLFDKDSQTILSTRLLAQTHAVEIVAPNATIEVTDEFSFQDSLAVDAATLILDAPLRADSISLILHDRLVVQTGNPTPESAVFSGKSLSITCATGVGTSDSPILTQVDELRVASSGGGVYVTELDGVTIRGIDTGGDDLHLLNRSGNLIVENQVNTGPAGIDAQGGDIVLTTDRIAIRSDIRSWNGSSCDPHGTLILQPLSPTSSIGVADGSTGDFFLSTEALNHLVDGFGSDAEAKTGITIGRADGHHNMTISSYIFRDSVRFRSPVVGGGLHVTGPVSTTDPGTEGTPAIRFQGAFCTTYLGADIVTTGSDIRITDNLIIEDGCRVLLSTGPGAGSIFIDGSIDGTTGGGIPEQTEELWLDAGQGNIVIHGAVGLNVPLENIRILSARNVVFENTVVVRDWVVQVSGSGSTTFNMGVTAGQIDLTSYNAIRFLQNVTTTVGDIALEVDPGAVSGLINVQGDVDSAGDLVVRDALNAVYNGNVDVTGALTQNAGADTIRFDKAVTAGSVDLRTDTRIRFQGQLHVGGGGNVFLTSDEIDFEGGTGSVSGDGILTLRPSSAVVPIDIGSPSIADGVLDLSDTDLAAIANGFVGIVIGWASPAYTAVTSGGQDSTKASATLLNPGGKNNLIIRAATVGAGMNGVTIIISDDGVSNSGDAHASYISGTRTLTIDVDLGVTTAEKVRVAVNGVAGFEAVLDEPDGSGPIIASIIAEMSGGAAEAQATATVEMPGSGNDLVFTAVNGGPAQDASGNGITINVVDGAPLGAVRVSNVITLTISLLNSTWADINPVMTALGFMVGVDPTDGGLTGSVVMGTTIVHDRLSVYGDSVRIDGSVTASDSLDITARAGRVTVTNGSVLSVPEIGGAVSVTALTDIMIPNGSIIAPDKVTLTATRGWIDMTAGVIHCTRLDAAAGMGMNLHVETNGVVNLSLTAPGNLVIEGDDVILEHVSTVDGSITVNAVGNIWVGFVKAGGANGAVALTSATGAILELGSDTVVDITAAVIDLTAANGIGAAGTLEISGGTIAADTTNGKIDLANVATGPVTVTTLTTGTGNIQFTQTGGRTLLVGLAQTASGDIAIRNEGATLTVMTASAGTTATGDGNITLTTAVSGDVLVGSVTATGDQVQVNAAARIEEPAAETEVDITAAAIDLNAANGIGSLGTLEISGTTIAADTTTGHIDLANVATGPATVTTLTTGTGNIQFGQTGGQALLVGLARTASGNIVIGNAGATLTVTAAATTTAGAISLTASGGALTAGTVTAGTALAGDGNITLTTTGSGDVRVGNVTAAGDAVQVNAAGAIEEPAAEPEVDITAAAIDLNAANGIGALGTLEISGGTIAADTTTGNIDLANLAAGPVTVTTLTTGTGSIQFTQTVGQTLLVGLGQTASGNIVIGNAGAALTVTTVSAGTALAGDGNITLTTSGSGDVRVGNVTAPGDAVQVNAAGAIEEPAAETDVDITAAVIDLNAVSGIGAAGTLEISGGTIAADSTSGKIDLANLATCPVTVPTLTTGAGDIQFVQTGGQTLTVATSSAGTALTGDGNITLTTIGSGDVRVGNVTATGDAVQVNAAGRIEESGADPEADITAAVIDLNAVSGIGAAGTLEISGGTITADSTSGKIDLANVATGAVTVTSLTTMTGTGDIQFVQTGGRTLLVGLAQTASGNIVIGNAGAALTVTTVSAGTAAVGDGNITLTTTGSGDVRVGNVTATGDAVQVNAAGRIEESGADPEADITAAVIDLNAGNGIGTQGTLEISGGTITADSTSGKIDLANVATGPVTVTSLTTGAGDIQFVQTGGQTLTVATASAGTAAAGDGNITLTTIGSGDVRVGNVTATGDAVQVNAAGRIEESGADPEADITAAVIDLNAGNGIGTLGALEISGRTIAADSASGNIDLANVATGAVTVTSLRTWTGTGDIQFVQTGGHTLLVTLAQTASGNIVLSNAGAALTVTTALAGDVGKNVTLTTTDSGDVRVDAVTAAGQVMVTSAGKIEESGADSEADITAATIDLNAASGIGAAVTLEISGGTIAADSTNGKIDLASLATGAVTVTSLRTMTGTGDIQFVQTGVQTLTVTLAQTASGNIAIGNTGAALTVATASAGTALADDGDITLTTTVSGDILVGNVTAAGDQVQVNAAGAIKESGADSETDITAAVIDLNAGDGIGAAGTLEISGGTITADTAAGKIDLANVAMGAVMVTSLTTGTGNILFAQTGGQTLLVATATTEDGSIVLNNAGAALTVTTALAGGVGKNVILMTAVSGDVLVGSVTAAGQVTVTSAGRIEESGADPEADITAAVIDLNAASGIGAAVTLEISGGTITADTATGKIDLANLATGAVTVTSLTTGAGDIRFVQTGGQTSTLTVTTASAGTAAVGDGDITLTTDSGDILVGNVTAAGDQVQVNAAGAIEESVPDGAVDITAAVIDLNAVSGIGAAGTLEISGGTISADTAAGKIDLANVATGAVTVTTLTTGAGDIQFVQTGGQTLTVTTASAGTAGAGDGDITLTTTGSGDVRVGNVTAAGDGVQVNAAGAIEESVPDGAVDITAAVIDLNAVSGIGAAGTLEISGGTILADTTMGKIDLANVATGAVTVTSLTTGAGDIQFVQTGGQTLTVTTASAGTAGAGDGDITLTTTGSGDVRVGSVTAAGDEVHLNSAGAITQDGDPGADVVGDVLTTVAVSGVDLDTAVTGLTGEVTGVGGLMIDEADGIVLIEVVTANGPVTVLAGGTITALDVESSTDAETNRIRLEAATGEIVVGYISAGTSAGDVILRAEAGMIRETTPEHEGVDIVGDMGVLFAAGGIGGSRTFEVSFSRGMTTNNVGLATLGATVTGTNGAWWALVNDGVSTGYTGRTGFGYTVCTGAPGSPGEMRVDLGRECRIIGLDMLLWDLDGRYYRYKVEAWDGANWVMVADRTTGKNRSWQHMVLGEAVEARYLKVTGTYDSLNPGFHVVELEVYGEAVVLGDDGGAPGVLGEGTEMRVNVALASRGTTIVGSNGADWGALIDGVTTGYTGSTGFGHTLWSPGAPGSMTLELQGLHTISSMNLLLWDLDTRCYRYMIEVSTTLTGPWATVVDRTTGESRGWQYLSFAATQARYVRLTGTYSSADTAFRVVEWGVYERSS